MTLNIEGSNGVTDNGKVDIDLTNCLKDISSDMTKNITNCQGTVSHSENLITLETTGDLTY